MDASLADIAAVTRDNDGWGNGNGLWLFAILALMGGGFNWGNRGFDRGAADYGTFATAASQQEILFGQQFQGLDNKIDRVGNGIADATFNLNNSVHNEGRGIQMQIADGFCTTQRNTDALRFELANYNAGILAAINNDGEKTRAMIQENKIEALRDKVHALELNQAMCGVVRYPNSMTYSAGGSPFCNNVSGYIGCGCGNI